MLDLVAALEWVRDNISAFGGDPSNVTIFGESGGGAKVSTLLAMPAPRGLFHRAVVQSGPALRVRSREQATKAAERTLTDLGVKPRDDAALAAVPVERLVDVQARRGRRTMFDFSPVLDGAVVAAHPGDALTSGTAPDVPIIIGCNRDEATLFLAGAPAPPAPAAPHRDGLLRRLEALGGDAEPIIAAYQRARPDASPRDLLVAIESDRLMRIPSIAFAERKLEGGKAPVYMYLFCWAAGPLGSAHGFEVPFVFDNARPPVMKDSPSRQALAVQMSEAWIAFARCGVPDHPGLPHWPAYSTDERQTMIFDRGQCHVERDPFGQERRAWEGTSVPTGIVG
jgi:para-nitrobenzyl esterase